MAKSYQEQIKELNPELQNADDDGIIGVGRADDDESDFGSRTKKRQPDEDEDSDEFQEDTVTDDEDDDDEEDSKSDEPTYKKGQVQQIVQTRVNTLNKRIEKLSGYKKAVDRICEITGLDFNSLLSKLDAMTDQQQAQILGMTVQQVQQARAARRSMVGGTDEEQSLRTKLGILELKQDRRYADVDLYSEEINDILADNPKLTVKQAYLLAKGDNAVNAAARDAEQRQIAKRVNANSKKVVKPASGAGSKGPKLSSDVIQAAKIAGMDPVEYQQFRNMKNIDDYYNFKKSKKG